MSDARKKGGWFSRFRRGKDESASDEADTQPAEPQEPSVKESLIERFKREVREQDEPAKAESEEILPIEVAEPAASSPSPPAVVEPAPKPKGGWLSRLRAGLSRSSNALTESISGIFVKRKLDDEALEELEDALIMADLGVEAAGKMARALADSRFGKEVTDEEIKAALADEIAKVLEPVAEPLPQRHELSPQVILVAGVNGVGKTTTIGKLAKQQMLVGRRVMMAACDTFRAAAVEQLEVWGQRNGCPVIKAKQGSDPAGLAFDALKRAQDEGYDVLLIDTAGRLQNKQELMEELVKIVRVIQKVDPSAPHDTLLVLDATTGQNTRSQVDLFNAMIELTGLIVTKLDGTAKGGVVVGLADNFGLPVYAVGVGETIDDLKPFEARAFARGLLGLEMADVA